MNEVVFVKMSQCSGNTLSNLHSLRRSHLKIGILQLIVQTSSLEVLENDVRKLVQIQYLRNVRIGDAISVRSGQMRLQVVVVAAVVHVVVVLMCVAVICAVICAVVATVVTA